MPKSPEDVALPYSVQIAELIFEAKENGGKLPRPINPIIAAAIREDRAEMVSECELTLDYVGGMVDELLQFGATDDNLRKIRARITKQLESLEAARKARAR